MECPMVNAVTKIRIFPVTVRINAISARTKVDDLMHPKK
jgi:hypothetical protein